MTATLVYAYNRIPTGAEEHPLPVHGKYVAEMTAMWGSVPGTLWERVAEGKTR